MRHQLVLRCWYSMTFEKSHGKVDVKIANVDIIVTTHAVCVTSSAYSMLNDDEVLKMLITIELMPHQYDNDHMKRSH